uniref:Uncharacterized protein n=1 Tax=Solanum tuberosum TaxID=4113 RepID=M1DSV5_SOLTU
MHRKRKIYPSQEDQHRLHHFSLQKRHQENHQQRHQENCQYISSTYFISLTSKEESIEDYIANLRHKLYFLYVKPDGVDVNCSRREIKCQYATTTQPTSYPKTRPNPFSRLIQTTTATVHDYSDANTQKDHGVFTISSDIPKSTAFSHNISTIKLNTSAIPNDKQTATSRLMCDATVLCDFLSSSSRPSQLVQLQQQKAPEKKLVFIVATLGWRHIASQR